MMMKKEEILEKYVGKPSRIAVVGASPKPERPVFDVMKYLADAGFTLFPVNPAYEGIEIAGRPCVGSIGSLPGAVDMVALFLSADRQESVASELFEMSPKPVVWFQPGAENESLAGVLEEKGFHVVPSACLMEDHIKMHR